VSDEDVVALLRAAAPLAVHGQENRIAR